MNMPSKIISDEAISDGWSGDQRRRGAGLPEQRTSSEAASLCDDPRRDQPTRQGDGETGNLSVPPGHLLWIPAPTSEDWTRLQAEKDGAYHERDQLVAALTKLFPASIEKHTGTGPWDSAWDNVIVIDLPSGQVSWHIHERELPLFAHLPKGVRTWDGHDTEEKYHRLGDLTHVVSAPPTTALGSVIAERARQQLVEKWTTEHDDGYGPGEQLAQAAACYAMPRGVHLHRAIGIMEAGKDLPPVHWPWEACHWKPKDRRTDLVRAAALLIAEIERLDRNIEPKEH